MFCKVLINIFFEFRDLVEHDKLFHNFAPVYLIDFKPYIVVRTEGMIKLFNLIAAVRWL